ncbi:MULTISPECIES: hypothetical protein [Amycolatopsis]|uniref:hypothetical protein n=1 Tax=Amycolatopsis TaxID=1813 RepID=UPI000B8AA1D5|nr:MULTISPECIES: hypothetical protein [Amycolatopsis]OXM72801.1 hypothetical protein CF166_13315 [Amycolatopsis sp. KNN50.9b]
MIGIQNVLTLLLIAVLIGDGYRRRGTGFFRWPMFSNHCAVVADLTVATAEGRRETVKMFHHLPAHAPWLPPRDFDVLVEYLGQSGRVEGSGAFYGNSKVYELEIVDSRVDIRSTRAQL